MRPALAGVLALALVACSGSESAPPPPAPPVAVTPVTMRDLTERIEATGQLLARDHAAIAAEVSGRVSEILVDEGSAVDAGQVILEIDPERRELELVSVRARLKEARANLLDLQGDAARLEKLLKQNVASETQLDQAHTDLELAGSRVEAAQAQLGVAERTLADASVSAPFDGLVAERFVSTGEFVQVGQDLVELVALDPIEVEFHLAEVNLSRVQLGQTVEVRVAPYPDEIFHAWVTMISPKIDPRTRTLRVKGVIDNSDGRLRPGLFARADLGVNPRMDVLLIPQEAILQRSVGSVVFRMAGDSVERRVIETGTWVEGMVEVTSGLEPDDSVVVRGHTALIDGSRVSVRNFDGTPAVALSARDEEETRE